MSNFAVISWSGTGNTEAMAKAVAEGIESKGHSAAQLSCGDFSAVGDYAGFAFGCPSMGSEVLEEGEFQPMWDSHKKELSGKKVVLFGSYGWGDGEWMRIWEEECQQLGIQVLGTLICNDYPGDDEIEECKNLASTLVG